MLAELHHFQSVFMNTYWDLQNQEHLIVSLRKEVEQCRQQADLENQQAETERAANVTWRRYLEESKERTNKLERKVERLNECIATLKDQNAALQEAHANSMQELRAQWRLEVEHMDESLQEQRESAAQLASKAEEQKVKIANLERQILGHENDSRKISDLSAEKKILDETITTLGQNLENQKNLSSETALEASQLREEKFKAQEDLQKAMDDLEKAKASIKSLEIKAKNELEEQTEKLQQDFRNAIVLVAAVRAKLIRESNAHQKEKAARQIAEAQRNGKDKLLQNAGREVLRLEKDLKEAREIKARTGKEMRCLEQELLLAKDRAVEEGERAKDFKEELRKANARASKEEKRALEAELERDLEKKQRMRYERALQVFNTSVKRRSSLLASDDERPSPPGEEAAERDGGALIGHAVSRELYN